MTPEDIEARVEAIRAVAHDPELAHAMEDDLWRDVLQAIADRDAEDVSCCAFVALTSQQIKFGRWTA